MGSWGLYGYRDVGGNWGSGIVSDFEYWHELIVVVVFVVVLLYVVVVVSEHWERVLIDTFSCSILTPFILIA